MCLVFLFVRGTVLCPGPCVLDTSWSVCLDRQSFLDFGILAQKNRKNSASLTSGLSIKYVRKCYVIVDKNSQVVIIYGLAFPYRIQ